MKKYITKVPETQKKEIRYIASELAKINWVEKIILFWSFARWNYVLRDVTKENWSTRVYKSDYDILVVLRFYKNSLVNKIFRRIDEIKNEKKIERSVDIIVEGITHLNTMIRELRYFYIDLIQEWILLHDTKKIHFAKLKKLTPEKRLKKQKEDFAMWISSWDEYFEWYETDLKKGYLSKSAFELHQATEKYITAYLLVKTWYRPKTHDLKDFVELLEGLDGSFKDRFRLWDPEEKQLFQLLRKAYIEARYSYKYRITKAELEFLGNKTLVLRSEVERLCQQEIVYIIGGVNGGSIRPHPTLSL